MLLEWDFGRRFRAAPDFSGACTFNSDAYMIERHPPLHYIGYSARVFAAGPVIVNSTLRADGRNWNFSVVGLTVPAGSSPLSPPPCGTATLANLSLPAPLQFDGPRTFAMDEPDDESVDPQLISAQGSGGMFTSSPPYVGWTALSPTTGALLWTVNVSVPPFPCYDCVGMSVPAFDVSRHRMAGVFGGYNYRDNRAGWTRIDGWLTNAGAASASLELLGGPSNVQNNVGWGARVQVTSPAGGAAWPLLFDMPPTYACATSGAGTVNATTDAFSSNTTWARTSVGVDPCPLPPPAACAFPAFAFVRRPAAGGASAAAT